MYRDFSNATQGIPDRVPKTALELYVCMYGNFTMAYMQVCTHIHIY